jgi:TonB family protein
MPWRSIRVGSLLVGATMACGHPPSPVTPPTEGATADARAVPRSVGPAPLVVPGDAVVRAGGTLWFASTGDAGVALPSSPSPGFAVHVVDRRDGRIEVEPLVDREHHCTAALTGLAHLRLRMFVDEADLVPVLAQHYDHAFADGTRVRLSRGAAVGSDGVAFARGTAVVTPVSASDMGLSYAPAEALPHEGGDKVLATLAGHPLEYGGHTLVEDELHRSLGGVVEYGIAERKDHGLVTVRNPCLEVTAKISLERLRASTQLTTGSIGASVGPSLRTADVHEHTGLGGASDDGELGLRGVPFGDGELGRAPASALAAGTAIYWPDGRAAGTVAHDHRLVATPRDEGGRRCVDVRLVADAAPTVALCFDAKDMKPSSPGLGGRGKAIPQVVPQTAEVRGSLSADIIRRIVRAHINEVRHCYHQGLGRDPALAGKVAVRFTIDAKGNVSSTEIAQSTLADAEAANCIATAVARWKFPAPEGGANVTVLYQFTLAPG